MGTIVNGIAIIVGGLIGLFAKKLFSKKMHDSVINILALCVLIIGIQGAIDTTNILIVITSLVLGCIVGEWIDIDKIISDFSLKLEEKYFKKDSGFAKGFTSASLLYCVGAMGILGSFQSAIGNNDILYTKSVLDGVSSIFFASAYGFGVLFSSIPVVLYQGFLTIFAGFISSFLSELMIIELTAVGSVMIIALSLNMLGVIKVKVANLLPALLFVIGIVYFL